MMNWVTFKNKLKHRRNWLKIKAQATSVIFYLDSVEKIFFGTFIIKQKTKNPGQCNVIYFD